MAGRRKTTVLGFVSDNSGSVGDGRSQRLFRQGTMTLMSVSKG